MADAAAVIRSYEAGDRKLVLFMVSKSNMEALAVANNTSTLESLSFAVRSLRVFFLLLAYLHPITLAVWIGLSAVFVQLMDWWPNELGLWSYLRTMIGFATMAFPILAYIDW
jgi:hypothetical protein